MDDVHSSQGQKPRRGSKASGGKAQNTRKKQSRGECASEVGKVQSQTKQKWRPKKQNRRQNEAKGNHRKEANKVPQRIDSSDSNAYTYDEFVEFYGSDEGKMRWEISETVGNPIENRSQKSARAKKRLNKSKKQGGASTIPDSKNLSMEASSSHPNMVEKIDKETEEGEITFDIEENRELAADEIEAMKSIYGEENVKPKGVNGFRILMSNDVEGRQPLMLTVHIPESYPSHTHPEFSVYADWITEDQQVRATAHLIDMYQQELLGCCVLFSWTEWLKENVIPPPAINPNTSTRDSSSENVHAVTPSPSASSTTPILGRKLLYSHHIIAQSKRDAVCKWATELDLGGLSKIGWPGAIIVEGPEANLNEYVRALKRLTWKHLAVRGEETIKGQPGQTLDELRVLPKKFRELGEDSMSDFAQACKSAGLHELFMTFIRKKSSKNDNDGKTTAIRRAKISGGQKTHIDGEKKNLRYSDNNDWVSGEFFVDRKSKFQGHVIPVDSREAVSAAMERLLSNRKIARATHNISAYRFKAKGGSDGFVKDCDDDGETAAGGRLLHLLDLIKAEGVLVVVTRWYGGVHLGPDRFRHINNVARKILEARGFVRSTGQAGRKNTKKK